MTARLAFEFMILTAARTGEVLAARWSEFDTEGAAWTIPAERMKAKREHRVPLSPRCLEILERAKELAGGDEYVFPGRTAGKPLSNMVFLMTLRRMGCSDITAHGFRSSFRDWAAERTNYPREVCEAALAHTLKDKTEAAYKRTDLFDARRSLLPLRRRGGEASLRCPARRPQGGPGMSNSYFTLPRVFSILAESAAGEDVVRAADAIDMAPATWMQGVALLTEALGAFADEHGCEHDEYSAAMGTLAGLSALAVELLLLKNSVEIQELVAEERATRRSNTHRPKSPKKVVRMRDARP